ncbi:ECF transporter S component [Iocasia frigidifontis]|uniref:ECF transporter S component n=1 Tax=Iocasia fonsfrigidae TaxID=2682810 RepID=A0A8A7KF68_9FIRM|nr:ECF transporter S component [Iocasia fonsfrigidae]QTL96804.1 ECF transporter S component [Iocasia fonsfrigidae]
METKKIVFMGIFIALGLVIPTAFHYLLLGSGSVFLPMHIPVLLAGVYLGPAAGFIVGAVTPLLCSLLTGMPPLLPMLPIMFVELSIYGSAIGYLYQRRSLGIFTSLILTMLLGRVGAGFVVMIMVHLFGMNYLPANPLVYIWSSIIGGTVGIVIQLILIPVLLKYLKGGITGELGVKQ